jgi:TRAP transporter TAXI family solute receptor
VSTRPATRVPRRSLLSAAAGLGAASALSGCLGQSWDDLPATSLTIATGNPGGVFHRYGEALASVLDDRLGGVSVGTRSTNASLVNLRQVARRSSDIGFSLGDAASDAVRGTGAFDAPVEIVALARTYDSFVHLVTPTDSGIEAIGDLRGRRVGLGAHGSGTRVISRRILAAAGLRPRELTPTADTLEVSAAATRQGRLDAFFFVSGLPNTAVRDLGERLPIRLVDLGGLVPDLTTAYGTEYAPGPVPASTYLLPDAVDTVSVKNYLVVHPDLDEDLAYAATRVMFEDQEEVDRIAPGIRQPNLGAAIFTSPLQLHPGAERYYRELRA